MHPHDVTIIFGVRGCGKSTLTRNLADVHPRRVVFDRLHEWNDLGSATYCTSETEFFEAWRKSYVAPASTIVQSFPLGAGEEGFSDSFNRILSLVYETGRKEGGSNPRLIVLEEAQFYASTYKCEPWLFETILTGRHAGLGLLANSQRPASVHKSLVSQASNIFVGQLREKRDLDYLAATVGAEAEQARNLERGEFLYFRIGEPVRLVRSVPLT